MVVTDSSARGNTARVNTSGGLSVTPVPHASGGLSTFHLASAASTNLTVIKREAGQIYGWYIYNSNAAARKLVFHDTNITPIAGANVFFTLVIPATSGANAIFSHGIKFTRGIGISTVTGLPDNNTTAVALSDLIINLFYK